MYSNYFSVKGLEELLHAPRVMSGGGCAETALANYITQWVGIYVTPMYFINKIICIVLLQKDKQLDSTLRQINSDTSKI